MKEKDQKLIPCSLREAQFMMLEILEEVHRICEENHIEYFLIDGTLLGAIRHGGFIPWDDDLDIGMTRGNYEKFKSIAKEELKKGFFLQSIETDKGYKLYHIPLKVRRDNTIFEEFGEENEPYHRGIYIDIFPYDKLSDNEFKAFIQKKFIGFLIKGKFKNLKEDKSVKGAIRKGIYNVLKPLSYEKLNDMAHNTLKWSKDSKRTSYNYGVELLWDNDFKESDLFPLKKIVFEGKEFWGPNNPDGVLTNIYGDYMTLPKEDERVWHAKGIYKVQGKDEN